MTPTLLRLCLAAHICLPAVAAVDAPVFEEDVLPIFSSYCLTCHGKSSPEMGLDLRTARTVLRGGFNGPVIRKGDPDGSVLFRKLAKSEMPPPAFKSQVPEASLETVRRWIATGARSNAGDQIPAAASRQIARFEKEILPLLSERCTACHSGDGAQAGLDLSSLAAMARGSAQGPVVIEGSSDKSVLIRQLASGAMPPVGSSQALSPEQVDLIRGWIDEGQFADWVDTGAPRDRALTAAEAPTVNEEDRRHWAFRRPEATSPPAVSDQQRAHTPIDAFILRELGDHGLAMASPAPKPALLRRAYFDLWGLPPTPGEASAFLADSRPDAFERLVDRLLASPKYGQRWGRFWLDAAGYVDTAGKDYRPENITLAPGMWRYRDYVIDAFNADKPWDRFLTEQLAGDELHDWRNATEYTPAMLEGLVATGYLRTVLDATDEDISNRPADRYDTLFALVDKVSRSAMGLTLSCARCHSHKFDPIPQRDYYRFLALLAPAYNPSAWIQPKHRLLHTVPPAERRRVDQRNRDIDREVEAIRARIGKIRSPYRDRLLAKKLLTVPDVVRADLEKAVALGPGERSDVQAYLVEKFGPSVEIAEPELDAGMSVSDRERLARLRGEIEALDGSRGALHEIRALWDGETLPVIRLLQRGSVESPGPAVQSGFLEILCAAGDECLATPSARRAGQTSGYRLALAEWLTGEANPVTARVAVNRIWQHHFGAGIVATADNFGRQGSPPSHPDLLDWLAVDFTRHGWSVKRLHRLIMLSAAYQQSSRRTDNRRHAVAAVQDPQNRLLWRRPLRRLEAEALRDAVLAVAGRLDTSVGGPPVMLDARADGLQIPVAQGSARRGVYLLSRRNWSASFMAAFDFPNMDTTCPVRLPSATPIQSLTFLNGDFARENAAALARRSLAATPGAVARPDDWVRETYKLALAREPTEEELRISMEHVGAGQRLYSQANDSGDGMLMRAVESLAHMLISSNEFLYVD